MRRSAFPIFFFSPLVDLGAAGAAGDDVLMSHFRIKKILNNTNFGVLYPYGILVRTY